MTSFWYIVLSAVFIQIRRLVQWPLAVNMLGQLKPITASMSRREFRGRVAPMNAISLYAEAEVIDEKSDLNDVAGFERLKYQSRNSCSCVKVPLMIIKLLLVH